MASDWLIEVCCRSCRAPIEASVAALAGVTALPCATCGEQADLPADLAETARFLFEETRRRLDGSPLG